MDDERTLVLVKPDAVERNLVGQIIKHFERSGIYIRAIKMMKMNEQTACSLYEEHKGKPFYNELVNYMTSAPIVAMIVEGADSVRRVRELIGPIRRMYATSKQNNAVHASDSTVAAVKEMECIFHMPYHADAKTA